MKRIRIKICGIKELSNALTSVEYGVDALGFIFYEKSPRYITLESANKIIKNIPAFVNKVGVFVNHNSEEIIKIFEKTGIDTIQLHGDSSFYNIEFINTLRNKINASIIYAIRLEKLSELCLENIIFSELIKMGITILIDRLDSKEYGGTGKPIFFDEIKSFEVKNLVEKNVIIAGGINSKNISEILKKVTPYAIDVSSGVEIEKGKKDNMLIKEFLDNFHKVCLKY